MNFKCFIIVSIFLVTLISSINAQNKTILEDNDNDQDCFNEFIKFTEKNSRNYTSMSEFKMRYKIFKDNMKYFNKTQVEPNELNLTDPEIVWNMGVSSFADLTPQEFSSQYLTYTNASLPENVTVYDYNQTNSFDEESNADDIDFLSGQRKLQTSSIPSSLDWRTYGAVTYVRNQGQCGSCWAFTASANIEGVYFIKYRRSLNLSTQQILDCNYYGDSCNGGTALKAFSYAIKTGGVMAESNYPYIGYKGTCYFQSSKVVAKVSSYISAGTKDESYIAKMIYQVGPVAAAMNANPLQFYTGGILYQTQSQCSPDTLNHAVLIIGYGISSNGTNYWIVKNTWGVYWGESGYFRVLRGYGVCGINTVVTSAVIQ